MQRHLSTILFIFIINLQFTYSQEWKNIKDYQKETGLNTLKDGCWLKKDRKRNTEKWMNANKYNLSVKNGNLKYRSIKQIQNFYLWSDEERKKIGHEINMIGLLAIVSGQFSKLENKFFEKIIIRNRELSWFGKEGAKKVFAFAFPLIQKAYTSEKKIIGQEAKKWDTDCIKAEQCDIVEALYKQLSSKSIQQLSRIAKGKGIYCLGVKKKLRFEGDINDCNSRYEHAFSKLLPYYQMKQ